jgi:dTDP-4-amino-4,6-dideoxygalactose transaminase
MTAAMRKLAPKLDPRVSIARPRLPSREALAPYLDRIDDARWYSNFGPLLHELEQRVAARLDTPAGVVTAASGTTALTLALRAAGARPGTLCAMPAWTFVATAHAALEAGLTPYFLDVDPKSWMLDPERTLQAIARAPGVVGAIMPVAAFGRMPDLEAWREVAHAARLPVIVDAAAAFDALTRAPVPVVVSLHATKTVATGEGGFVASEDADFLRKVRQLSSFGFDGRRVAERPALNGKLSEYAAAVGLASLDAWPADRARFSFAAQFLKAALALTPQIEFQPGWGTSWISSVCVVGAPDGSATGLGKALGDRGVETRDWWGSGCHRHPAFAECPHEPLPVTERLAVSTLGLPYYLDLDETACRRVVAALSEGLGAIHG